MKKKIHPKWHTDAKVTCACGKTHTVGSTEPEVRVEICSGCHPFFTGQEKLIDTEGRVEKFEKRQKKATDKKEAVKKKVATKKTAKKTKVRPKSLKEMVKLAKEN